MLREVTTWIPPRIADLDIHVHGAHLADSERTIRTIARLDEPEAELLRPLARLLLRAESVASSKIEHEEASVTDFARALHGVRANASATAMVAAANAIEELMTSPLSLETITAAHARLMADDPRERTHAGHLRSMQNWIGGSDHSPRNALYVPPPPELVRELMDDLLAFARRTDLPAIAQAAIAHAQFESIHPFTDGNGRVGRALAAGMLRERGTARNVVVPIASALVAQRDHYFATLGRYRNGDAGPIIHAFSQSAAVAAEESLVTAERLRHLPEEWREAAGRPRAGSGAAALLASLMIMPIFDADDVETTVGLTGVSVYRAVNRLETAGILVPLTDRKRGQVWGAAALLAELDDLGVRIAARSTDLLPVRPR